jgi:hypothetical protein
MNYIKFSVFTWTIEQAQYEMTKAYFDGDYQKGEKLEALISQAQQ